MSLIRSISGNEICDQYARSIQIGGRNLLKNSDKMPDAAIGNGSVVSNSDGSSTITNGAASTWIRYGSFNSNDLYADFIPVGMPWAFSIDIKTTSNVTGATFGVYLSQNTGYFDSFTQIGSDWTRIKIEGHTRGGSLSDTLNIHFRISKTGTFVVRHPKLEFGNKATDYTQAPEDCSIKMSDDGNGNVTIKTI